MREAYSEIVSALDLFFDGFYEGDIEKLKRIFHPNCHLFSAADGPLEDDDMPAVYDLVENRLSPKDRNQPRYDRIISIDISGPEAALATLVDVLLNRSSIHASLPTNVVAAAASEQQPPGTAQ